MSLIRSPRDFFGFEPGADGRLIPWADLVSYYRMLGRDSDRVRCIERGPTTLGNPFLELVISSPANLADLERHRAASKLLADPRGADPRAIDRACAEGRAVCVQTMSVHATEIGGAQMSPLLAWDLAAGEGADVLGILDNVILVLVPCFNPDGQAAVAAWYARHQGTENDAVDFPRLWHPYAGYGNYADVVFERFPESRYLNDILFHEWMPQVYADHHQMPRTWARCFVPPYKNPQRPFCSPLVWREIGSYGAAIACDLEAAGVQGVISNAYFPTMGASGWFTMAACHNIAGILTESASARLASPYFVHPESISAEPEGGLYPNPWRGGAWRLSDIVRQQRIAALAILRAMAGGRERILRAMAEKAMGQTRAGAANPIQAFLIPEDQHDPGCAREMVGYLRRQGIELHEAAQDVRTASGTYPAGTIVVPLAQPKYALVMSLLGTSEFPRTRHTLQPDGAVEVYELATESLRGFMGVRVAEAGRPLDCRLAQPREPQAADDEPLPCAWNDSYRRANALLAAGVALYRSGNGDFHRGEPPAGSSRIAPMRVGVYQTLCGVGRLGGGNADEGQTRLLLELYGFPYATVRPGDVAAGALDGLDALIIPDNLSGDLNGANEAIKELLPEDRVWLGPAEEERLRAFVRRGGRLLAFARACEYVISVLGLKARNRAAGLPSSRFMTRGSLLRARAEASPLTRGMPGEFLAFHMEAPILEITEYFKPGLYRADARFAESRLCHAGVCVGEELAAGQPCLVTAACGKGEAVLYGFSPQFRTQTAGTFKLVFNALYREEG
jgi:hypothetical protein